MDKNFDIGVVVLSSEVQRLNSSTLVFLVRRFVESFVNDVLKLDKKFKKYVLTNETAKKLFLLVVDKNDEFFSQKDIPLSDFNINDISRIIRFIELIFHLFEYWGDALPISVLIPPLTERDSFYRPGVDNYKDKDIWEYPLSSRKERYTKCKYCLLSAGQISHDVVLCYNCKTSCCLQCALGVPVGIKNEFNPSAFSCRISSNRNFSIFEWTKCRTCGVSLGASALPKVFMYLLSETSFENRERTCRMLILEKEIFNCFEIAIRLSKTKEELPTSFETKTLIIQMCTRILNIFSLMTSFLPGFMDFSRHLGMLKAHYIRSKSEKNQNYLSRYLKTILDLLKTRVVTESDFIKVLITGKDIMKSSDRNTFIVKKIITSFEEKVTQDDDEKEESVLVSGFNINSMSEDYQIPYIETKTKTVKDSFSKGLVSSPHTIFCQLNGRRRLGESYYLHSYYGGKLYFFSLFHVSYLFDCSDSASEFIDSDKIHLLELPKQVGSKRIVLPYDVGEDCHSYEWKGNVARNYEHNVEKMNPESRPPIKMEMEKNPQKTKKLLKKYSIYIVSCVYRRKNVVIKIYCSVRGSRKKKVNYKDGNRLIMFLEGVFFDVNKKVDRLIKKYEPSVVRNILSNHRNRRNVGVEKCGYCGTKKKKMKLCGRCKKIHYCSRECQVKHWKSHKKSCKE